MIVRFAPSASQDLEDIGDYIGQDNPSAAYRFVRDLRARCKQLSDTPYMGKARPDIGANLRSLAFRKYVIFYSAGEREVRIERILHGSRDAEAALHRQ